VIHASSPVTRRQLLAWGAAAGAAATLRGLVGAPASVARQSWMRRATYTGRIGQTFHAVADGSGVALRLAAVEDLPTLAGSDDAFLLEFSGPRAPRLTQGVVELRHKALGRTQLFLVPEAPGEHGQSYAVVVNRA
jgi:hypothetical protein